MTMKEFFAMRPMKKSPSELFVKAVTSGALTVSENGTKRLNMGRFVELQQGKERLGTIVREMEQASKSSK